MDWIATAITAAALIGINSVISSHLLSKRLPSLLTFLMPVGALQLIFSLIILGIKPLPEGVGIIPIFAGFGSGIIRGIGIAMMLNMLRSREVSRVIPVAHTFPIFVAILAVPLLGEALGLVEWLAILLTVGGAVLISLRGDVKGGSLRLDKSFAVLLVSSLFVGIANICIKYALDYISFWNAHCLDTISVCIVFLILSVKPRVLREIREMKQRGTSLGLLVIGEVIILPGIILSFWAIERGLVSLVSTIMATRPAFVFIYALVLSRVFPTVLNERLTKGTVMIKTASIALIIGGVTLLTL